MGGYERRSARPSSTVTRPASSASRPTSTAAARGRLGPLRGDRRERAPARAADGGRARHARSTARGVHARQRVLPRRDRRPGLFVATGCCAHGLAGAGGIGKVMAEWIDAGEPSLDLWSMDVRRFGPRTTAPPRTRARARDLRDLLRHSLPGHEREAGRPLRLPPAYSWHREHGAAFGEKSGWERVNWYESNAARATSRASPRGWAGGTGRPPSAPSTEPCREAVALFDEARSRSSSRRARGSCAAGAASANEVARSGASPTRRC